ncbi:MAG: heavy-metal-associated domain-containing protein, partial [Hyphomicrobiaceae bacterium]|nr:heavy-metal-associated domain-containing protein [Hyphomicrobiaceae bacterium]
MYTLKVEGMTCQGCARSVERVVGALKPCAAVSVALEEGLVSIEDSIARDAAAE